MVNRPVKLGTLWSLLKFRWLFTLCGVLFVFIPLPVIAPMALFLRAMKAPYEGSNYETIKRDGAAATASITAIQPRTNVTINGQHPWLITYKYVSNGYVKTDKFETFDDLEQAETNSANEVSIKVLNGESVIPSLKPFVFPSYLFWLIAAFFTLVG